MGATGRISDVTRTRVRDAALRLGYTGNSVARNLRSGRHGVIGVYLRDDTVGSEYYMRFVFGAAERARVEGFALSILGGGT